MPRGPVTSIVRRVRSSGLLSDRVLGGKKKFGGSSRLKSDL